jgi:hypothetical protein
MLAKGGKIIADDARKVRFHLEDEHIDPNSGKPVANVVVYEYEDGRERSGEVAPLGNDCR